MEEKRLTPVKAIRENVSIAVAGRLQRYGFVRSKIALCIRTEWGTIPQDKARVNETSAMIFASKKAQLSRVIIP